MTLINSCEICTSLANHSEFDLPSAVVRASWARVGKPRQRALGFRSTAARTHASVLGVGANLEARPSKTRWGASPGSAARHSRVAWDPALCNRSGSRRIFAAATAPNMLTAAQSQSTHPTEMFRASPLFFPPVFGPRHHSATAVLGLQVHSGPRLPPPPPPPPLLLLIPGTVFQLVKALCRTACLGANA